MGGSFSQVERYFAADCALLFATSLAAIVVTFGLMWLARRRGDPARLCLLYTKIAAVFFIVFCFIDFTADAVWLAFSRMMRSAPKNSFEGLDFLSTLLKARVELAAGSRLADCFVVIFLLLATVTLGIGVNIMRLGEQNKVDMLIKKSAYVLAVVLTFMAVGEWTIRTRAYLDFYTQEYRTTTENTESLELLTIARKIDLAFVVIQWAASVFLVVRSIQIWVISRGDKRLDRSPLFQMFFSFLFLARSIYGLVYQLKFINLEDIQHDPTVPPYFEVLGLVFLTWTMFAIIFFMLVIGVKKSGGLWSIDQCFEEDDRRRGDDIHLESRSSSPPAYSPPQNSYCIPAQPTQAVGIPQPPPLHVRGGQSGELSQGWQQSAGSSHPSAQASAEQGSRVGLVDHDRWMVENLEPPQQRGGIADIDNGYNTGIDILPLTESEAGPANVYDMSIPSQSPPPHAEVMGLNHQADGFTPRTEPLPYPEKN